MVVGVVITGFCSHNGSIKSLNLKGNSHMYRRVVTNKEHYCVQSMIADCEYNESPFTRVTVLQALGLIFSGMQNQNLWGDIL